MSVEDQLRAAGRALSDQVRDLPELDLTAAEPARRRARGRTRPARRWPAGWLVPLAAAAAVVAVATVLVVVRNPPHAAPKPSARPSASSSGTSAPAPADPEALPRYFVSISGLAITGPLPPAGQSGPAKAPLPDSVVVGDTLTGQRLATIKPPSGSTFAGVTGAADDRTFVLDSVAVTTRSVFLFGNQPRTWYLLRIRPGVPVSALTRLNIPVPAAADVNGIALSPDGTRLAVLYQVARAGDGFPYSGPFTLAVYSVATGAVLRSWTGTDPYHGSYGYGSDDLPDSNANLTWTSTGQQVAFAYRNSKSPDSSLLLREVDLAAPGGDLFRESSVIAKIAASMTTGRSKIWCDSIGITGDGRTAVCGAELPKAPPVGATLDALTEPAPWTGCAAPTDTAYPGIAEIALDGDRLARVLYQVKPSCMGGGYSAVLWSSPSGSTVLGVVSYTDDPSMTEHSAVVLYRHGRATALTWPGAADTLLANQTAF